jgi:homoserine O-acetyltransferase
LHAVVGISMGGMLAFEWMVAYPGVAKKGVSIVGTPRTQPVDQRRWEGRVASLQSTSKWGRVTRALLACRPRTAVVEARTDVTNHIRQAQAIVSHDIARRFAGSLEAAAAAVTAELLVVAAATDREVDPAPGFAFARMIDAETLELDGRCGHHAPICDQPRLWREVSAFLAR